MAKTYSFAALAALLLCLFISCSKDWAAKKPVYLSVPDITLDTNTLNRDEGTSSHKITTVWIFANGQAVGAFELPCTVPAFLEEGDNTILMYAGINLNGVSASRAIYEGFEGMEFNLNYAPSGSSNADTIEISEIQRTTHYTDLVTVTIIEDFDGSGLNLEKTNISDTNARKVSDSLDVFINYQDLDEDNGRAGVLYTNATQNLAEVVTVKSLQLPIGGANVYLEMNYKCNIPFIVGVVSDLPDGSSVKQATFYVTPKDDWNKIYINLVTEVSAQVSATGYKVYFRADHDYSLDTGKVFLDNLKLVY